MFFRAKRTLRRARFNFNTRDLLHTPPIDSNNNNITLVTMLCHGEVMMYLLAAKSFCRQLGSNPSVVILDDGSLTKSDAETLRTHIPKVQIVPISQISTGRCPKGSCWERLLLINDLVQNTYVVQLDSDTLTLNVIPEVKQCIEANRSFTLLGDKSYPEIEPMLDAQRRYKDKDTMSKMVQPICERSFDQLPEAANLRYLRGNAGFTGFAQQSLDREKIEWFSELMRRIAQGTWDDWGSEQVTSNLLIANTDNALPLPFPKYLSYWAHTDVPYDAASFIHFIGPYRFANGFYLRKAKEVISSLS